METKVKTHIGSYGVIVKNNKIVLIRKARGGYKGKLDLPGGGIEHLEVPEEALKRELLEEANLLISKYELLDCTATNITWNSHDEVWEDLHHIGILYRIEEYSGELKTDADGLDSEGASWYEISKLKENELSPFAKYSLKKLGYELK